MDAFYEEDERILGHAADNYHRLDIRATSRHLLVRSGARVIADTTAPLVLYESGFAPRWYVPRTAIDATALTASRTTTFCPYKGVARYYNIDGDIDGIRDAAWFCRDALDEAARIDDLVSFEPDKVDVYLDGRQLHLPAGRRVVAHGADRDLTADAMQGATRRDHAAPHTGTDGPRPADTESSPRAPSRRDLRDDRQRAL